METVPLDWIENIRASRTFEPRIIELMANTFESPDMWWRYREEDKVGTAEYAKLLNRIKLGDEAAFEQYSQIVMARFRG